MFNLFSSLSIVRHIFIGGSRIFEAPSPDPRILHLGSISVSTRMPARNQTTNTAGNADPDNSTDDRFWHRFQRGREHRYHRYVISSARNFPDNPAVPPVEERERERERTSRTSTNQPGMSTLSRLCSGSSIAGIGFLIECRGGFYELY